VDTSYYAIPLAQTAQNWADRTPAHFTMNMKAFRLFTGHATSAKVLPPDLRAELPPLAKANFYFKDVPPALREALWQRFKDALEPIAARVERLAPETFSTHVVMNNNNEDQGQRNAATLMRILARRRETRVPKLVARATSTSTSEALETEDFAERSEWVTDAN